jgi:hypothetical protein
MVHVSSSPYPSAEVVTIDGCLRQATRLGRQWPVTVKPKPPEHLHRIFTALADGDERIGLLAYYLWRRQARR